MTQPQIAILPAGNYKIGDLCYNNDDWREILEHPDAFNNTCTGKLKDGREFWFSGTAYGDGTYSDQHGNQYYVDSGTIGCIRVGDSYFMDKPAGRTFKMEQRFECYYENGKICINGLIIDTDPAYNDEEEEEDYD